MVRLSHLACIILPWAFGLASEVNEFKIYASSYDDLRDHARNCNAKVDEYQSVLYCQDGDVYLDKVDNLLNPTNFKVTSQNSYQYDEGPLDVRISQLYVSILKATGYLEVFKMVESEWSSLEMKLNTDIPSGNDGVLISGLVVKTYVVLQIQNQDTKFVQVHSLEPGLPILGVIGEYINQYDTFDSMDKDTGYFYLYGH